MTHPNRPFAQTELALLRKMYESRTRSTSIMSGYRTGRKRGAYGGRLVGAVVSLMKRGLIRLRRIESFRDCRNCYTDHWTEATYELLFPDVEA